MVSIDRSIAGSNKREDNVNGDNDEFGIFIVKTPNAINHFLNLIGKSTMNYLRTLKYINIRIFDKRFCIPNHRAPFATHKYAQWFADVTGYTGKMLNFVSDSII